jgi:hypothetical protein
MSNQERRGVRGLGGGYGGWRSRAEEKGLSEEAGTAEQRRLSARILRQAARAHLLLDFSSDFT